MKNHTISLGFSRADGSAPDTAGSAELYRNHVPEPIPGSMSLTKKREFFPGLPLTSPSLFAYLLCIFITTLCKHLYIKKQHTKTDINTSLYYSTSQCSMF